VVYIISLSKKKMVAKGAKQWVWAGWRQQYFVVGETGELTSSNELIRLLKRRIISL